MRGRETLRPRLPGNLQLFEPGHEPVPVAIAAADPEPLGFKARLERWISGAAH
jgi:hypothetical protein